MSGLINLFKSIFSGIFGFIGGLFGSKKAIEGSAPKSKKGNGYFMELDESKVAPVAATEAPKAEAKPAEQPMTVSKETIAEAAKTDKQPTKASTRKEKLAALAADKPATATAAATPAASEAPAAPTPTPAVTKAPVSDTAFATKYLVPANNGTRRRPGANMSSYLDMARKINTAS